MIKDSAIIRTEIIRVLHESGRIRGNELVNRVIKKTGNEKMIYREISSLVESGEVDKKMKSKSHIEYELINLSEAANNQLKDVHNDINSILDAIKEFDQIKDQNNMTHQEKLRAIIHFIQIVQSTDAIMRLLSQYPNFRKDKMFSQITRKLNDCWEGILEYLVHQPENEFLNELIKNLKMTKINPNNLN